MRVILDDGLELAVVRAELCQQRIEILLRLRGICASLGVEASG